ncbi:unnamed protein product [Gulo gulo]|uniref:Uncharacterized protein n=1 Tax=Gulo gulo TaxID=48420 RepID=A0A9X9M1H5_GULGU|nr:unnamed protein product [Gulo gulo]
MLGLGALALGLGDHILVEGLHHELEAGELHHGVGDLPQPQQRHALVEGPRAVLGVHPRSGGAQRAGEAGLRLHAHLHCLQGSQRHVREELGAGRRGQVQAGSPLVRPLRAQQLAEADREDLVEPELEQALQGVPQEGLGPASGQAAQPVLARRRAEAAEDALVLAGVCLQAALDQVQGHDGRVRQPAAQHAAQAAQQQVPRGAVLVGLLLLLPRRCRPPGPAPEPVGASRLPASVTASVTHDRTRSGHTLRSPELFPRGGQRNNCVCVVRFPSAPASPTVGSVGGSVGVGDRHSGGPPGFFCPSSRCACAGPTRG